jgi:hypothetical protein
MKNNLVVKEKQPTAQMPGRWQPVLLIKII